MKSYLNPKWTGVLEGVFSEKRNLSFLNFLLNEDHSTLYESWDVQLTFDPYNKLNNIPIYLWLVEIVVDGRKFMLHHCWLLYKIKLVRKYRCNLTCLALKSKSSATLPSHTHLSFLYVPLYLDIHKARWAIVVNLFRVCCCFESFDPYMIVSYLK